MGLVLVIIGEVVVLINLSWSLLLSREKKKRVFITTVEDILVRETFSAIRTLKDRPIIIAYSVSSR